MTKLIQINRVKSTIGRNRRRNLLKKFTFCVLLSMILGCHAVNKKESSITSVDKKAEYDQDSPVSDYKVFPFTLPKKKPDQPLSKAMERNYSGYSAPRPEDNELRLE